MLSLSYLSDSEFPLVLLWIIMSLATYVVLEIYLRISDKIDEDDSVTGIKMHQSRKDRIESIGAKLIFVFSISGLSFLLSIFVIGTEGVRIF